jgi:uncharacterized membrane protein
MSDVPVQVVVAAFQDEKGADEALKELKRAKWAGVIGIQDAAVVRRDEKNKLHIKETGDWGGGKGAVVGGLLGGAIGLLAGPVGWIGLTGAVIGGLAAKLRDSGIPDERLETLGEALKPGTSAIVAIIEHKWVEEYENMVAEEGARVLTQAISDDIAAQLEEGGEVKYTAVSTDEAVAISREAVSEDKVEIGGLILTEDGLAFKQAVATEEGIVARRGVITDEGAVVEGAVVTEEGAVLGTKVITDEGVAAAAVVITPEEGEAEAESSEGEGKEE